MGCGRVENMPMGRGERVGKLVDAMGCRSESSSRSMLRFRCGLIVLAVAIAGGSPSAAEFVGEEPVAVKNAIGDGMHAYHAGDYDRAYDDLTNAIEAGTDDPRAYYFRGLAALRLGRTSEAEADFTTGADRELVTGSMRRASQSLERVQGTDRLSLEHDHVFAGIQGLGVARDVGLLGGDPLHGNLVCNICDLPQSKFYLKLLSFELF